MQVDPIDGLYQDLARRLANLPTPGFQVFVMKRFWAALPPDVLELLSPASTYFGFGETQDEQGNLMPVLCVRSPCPVLILDPAHFRELTLFIKSVWVVAHIPRIRIEGSDRAALISRQPDDRWRVEAQKPKPSTQEHSTDDRQSS